MLTSASSSVSSVNSMTGDVTITPLSLNVYTKPEITALLSGTSGGAVSSVNGQTGDVTIPLGITSFNGLYGDVNVEILDPLTIYTKLEVNRLLTESPVVKSLNGQIGDLTINPTSLDVYTKSEVDSIILSANPTQPQLPTVRSVNGMIGDVMLDLTNPDSYTKTEVDTIILSLPESPVTSVNGQIGNVVIDLSSLNTFTKPEVIALIDASSHQAAPVTSVNGQVGDVVLTTTPASIGLGQVAIPA